jgi:hypothetical protein
MRLDTAGCDVSLTGTDWHTTGDFSPPPPPGDGLPLGRRIPSQPSARAPIGFDARFVNKGGNSIDKLQIINRGIETAYDVTLVLPEVAALSVLDTNTIPKIPGGGKSVTIDVMGDRSLGGPRKETAFDISISAKTESGEAFAQEVFLDMNG